MQAHQGIVDRDAFPPGEGADRRSIDVDRTQDGLIFRLEGREQPHDAAADVFLRHGRGAGRCLVREGLQATLGDALSAFRVDDGVEQNTPKPAHYVLVGPERVGFLYTPQVRDLKDFFRGFA
jgi:hypothetical protein